jgi:hypothetical protein
VHTFSRTEEMLHQVRLHGEVTDSPCSLPMDEIYSREAQRTVVDFEIQSE